MSWHCRIEDYPDLDDDLITAIESRDAESPSNRLVDGARIYDRRTVRFHSGIVVGVNRARISGIHKGAIDHVIGVVSKTVIRSRIGAPVGCEFDRAVFQIGRAS